MKSKFTTLLLICVIASVSAPLRCQTLLTNIEARNFTSLDGRWEIIIDPFNGGAGNWKPIWKDQHGVGKSDFYEYQFDQGITLHVPGDWNSQQSNLLYYEGTVWYKRTFT